MRTMFAVISLVLALLRRGGAGGKGTLVAKPPGRLERAVRPPLA